MWNAFIGLYRSEFLLLYRDKYPLTAIIRILLWYNFRVILPESGHIRESKPIERKLLIVKKMFELVGLLLVFVIQAAVKCQATFCSDRHKTLQQELYNHCIRCVLTAVNSECCEAENSSLKERGKNHGILCGEFYNKLDLPPCIKLNYSFYSVLRVWQCLLVAVTPTLACKLYNQIHPWSIIHAILYIPYPGLETQFEECPAGTKTQTKSIT